MKCRRWIVAALVAWAACAACDGPAVDSGTEIAQELRALRSSLREARSQSTQPADAAAVLLPLRGAVEAIAQEQRTLAERQSQLVQELQRWSQLVVARTASADDTAVQALTARLQQLEQDLAAQQRRHSEVEATLRAALDRTADHLEAFLRRLEAPPPAPDRPKDGPASPPGEAAPEPAAAAEPRRGAAPAWFGLALFAAALAGHLLWRSTRTAHAAVRRDGPEVGAMDPAVDQLWAAAEELGAAAMQASPEPLAASEPMALADLSTVADRFVPPGPPAGAAAPEPDPAPHVAAPARVARPAIVAFVLPSSSQDAARAASTVRDLLAADPRVLRRPAPEVAAADGRIAVHCSLLPTLSPGERAHLEQRLRDAVA